MQKYEDIKIYIVATNFLLAVLLFLSLFLFAYQINKEEYDKAFASLQAVIPIAAAWLVLCIADRQMLVDNRERELQRKLDSVKSLHYLIVIGRDLKAQAGHLSFMLSKEDYTVFPHQLEALAIGIEKRYEEMLHEKDAYRILSGDVLNKMLGLSGSIFGITNLLRSIVAHASSGKKSIREVFKEVDKDKITKLIEKNGGEIESIVEDFYKARKSI